MMDRARVFARGDERRRCEKRRVARWVDVTREGSREVELGGEARAYRRGVTGGASDGSARYLKSVMGVYDDEKGIPAPSGGSIACTIACLISSLRTKF